MPLYLYNKPILPDPMGGYFLDVRAHGVYADLKSSTKNLGAPFGAVSWKSADWDEVTPIEKTKKSQLLSLLRSHLRGVV